MSFHPFFRSVAEPQGPRRHSAPDIFSFLRRGRLEQGEGDTNRREGKSKLAIRPPVLRRTSSTPTTVQALIVATPVNEPIIVDLSLGQSPSDPSPHLHHRTQDASHTRAGLGLGLPAYDDADDRLVELLPGPMHPYTGIAIPARLPNPRTISAESVQSYTQGPPGLTESLLNEHERVVDVSDSGFFDQTMDLPNFVVVAPEDDFDIIAVDIIPPTPTPDALDALDMMEVLAEEGEDGIAIEVVPPTPGLRRQEGQMHVPPTPGAPRLPHVTRFPFDPLYA
ncbi:uncharacterized protein C8Q71DRAFT_903917 [Rhodofomes roseus]|uniref:Uncharacterized protein n=1 Tax=Rhodofomes roseus TaxID=34475 RepID=A0ABQ8KV14_9APHY|nr:uncharacterized protein C8Q71DRAFT_903917 [Rhodofomes roseus]KAH9842912.1 hypothetical protein C8Q71DRAFT_903917 [Rhodofomes roseus]